MTLCFDTSSIIKRYLTEPGTSEVETLVETANAAVLSRLVLLEATVAFRRYLRLGDLSSENHALLLGQLDADGKDLYTIHPVTDRLVQATLDTVRRAVQQPLRAADAIHIQTAMDAEADTFVTADRQQASAAEAFGLNVFLVGEA